MKPIKQLGLAEMVLPKASKPNPGREGKGGSLVASGGSDRACLSEEREWSATDAAGHNIADSFHAAMVWLL